MRLVFDGLFAAAIVVPGVVIGIATLVALVAVFSVLNPALAGIWPGENPPQFGLGYGSIIAAHGLFSMARRDDDRARPASPALAAISSRPPAISTRPRWAPSARSCCRRSCRRSSPASCSPSPSPSTISSSPSSSPARRRRLPIYVFASIRRGVTPEINAVATAGAGRLADPDLRGAHPDAREKAANAPGRNR